MLQVSPDQQITAQSSSSMVSASSLSPELLYDQTDLSRSANSCCARDKSRRISAVPCSNLTSLPVIFHSIPEFQRRLPASTRSCQEEFTPAYAVTTRGSEDWVVESHPVPHSDGRAGCFFQVREACGTLKPAEKDTTTVSFARNQGNDG